MKVYSEDLVRKHMGEAHIPDLASATIGQMMCLAHSIADSTGIPFIHLEQGDPGLPASVIGINAEIEALKRGVPGKYPQVRDFLNLRRREAVSLRLSSILTLNLNQ